VDEAEIDDVAGEDWVVAVAEGEEDVGFGEHQLPTIISGLPPPLSILRKV
jgi:hypothetical protein